MTTATAAVSMIFAAHVFAAPATTATYKGTAFGASEKTFLSQHPAEDFACADAPPTSVGRWCQSQTATYGGARANVIAQFLHDRLLLVSIAFDEPQGDVALAAFDVNITGQLEQLYGKPTEVYWPGRYGQGGQGGTLWKKVWHQRGGASVTYVHFDAGAGPLKDQRSVFLQSKDADKLLTNRKPSDM